MVEQIYVDDLRKMCLVIDTLKLRFRLKLILFYADVCNMYRQTCALYSLRVASLTI